MSRARFVKTVVVQTPDRKWEDASGFIYIELRVYYDPMKRRLFGVESSFAGSALFSPYNGKRLEIEEDGGVDP